MPAKIRLQRHGKKRNAFYHIVVADSRSKRDGRFIEKLGTYNPNTNPALVDLDVEGAVNWLAKGAQPTDTARSILADKGVLLKYHLIRGAKKGAFAESEVETRFTAWLEGKAAKDASFVADLNAAKEAEAKKRLAAEVEINEARKKALEAKNTPAPEETTEAPAEGETSAE